MSPKIVVPVVVVLVAAASFYLMQDDAPVPPPPGVDSNGDPLPPWAVARIGRFVATPIQAPFVFSPDGKTVTAVIGDGEIGVIDVATGEVLSRTRLFAPAPGTVRVDDGRFLTQIRPDEDDGYVPKEIRAISPDGKHAALHSRDLLEIVRTDTGQVVRAIPVDACWSVTFTPDGLGVVLGGEDVRRIDIQSGAVEWTVPHVQPLAVALLGEDRVAVNGHQFLYAEIESQTEIASSLWGYYSRGSIAAAPDARSFVRLETSKPPNRKGYLVLYEANGGEIRWRRSFNGGATLSYSPDGSLIAVGGRSIRLVRAIDGKHEARFASAPLFLDGLTFSPDGKRIAATRLGRLLQWDVETRTPIGTPNPPFDPPGSGVRHFVWSGDSAEVLVTSHDDIAHAFDAATGKLLREVHLHEVWKAWRNEQVLTEVPPDANHAIRSPCGQFVAAHFGGPIRVIETETGESIFEIKAMSGSSHIPLAVSPGGKLLAWAGQTSVIELWSVAGERRIVRLAGHAGNIQQLDFSPDGRRLASRSADGTALIWDMTAFE